MLLILVTITYLLITVLLDIGGGNEIHYSQAMLKIKENSNQVTKIAVKPKNNEVSITIKENGKNIRYTTIVPNTETFIETVEKLKANNKGEVDVVIRKPITTYLGYFFKYLLIYWGVSWFWKKIFKIFLNNSKKSDNTSKNEKNLNLVLILTKVKVLYLLKTLRKYSTMILQMKLKAIL